jgi:putative ABC transport system permease protein
MFKSLSSLSKNWKRNKGFLIVNITGLAIGLAVSILLLLYVMNEWSYDRHFSKKDRIVQLNSVWIQEGKKEINPICTRKAYTELPQNIPGIEKAVQLYRGWDVEVIRKPEHFQNLELLYGDQEFFDFFDMDFVYGTAANALINPYSAVLIRSKAEAIFGKVNPVGQTFTIDGEEFTVSGVVEKLPANTHFNFDILASMKSIRDLENINSLEFFTYFLIKPNVLEDQVCQEIRKEYTAMLAKRFSDFGSSFDTITEPLTRIHLFSKAGYGLNEQGSLKTLLLLVGLAFLILLLAITNFVNLFLVQGSNRSTEVGIRKTNGAGTREISRQFFGEAAMVVFISFLIGFSIAVFLLPSFSSLIHKNLEASLFYNPIFISGTILLIISTVIFSASYPAFYLSRFHPVDILKKTTPNHSRKNFTMPIVIFQSVITIVLISVLLIVNKQSNYLKSIPAGFNPKNVMLASSVNNQISKHYDALRQNLMKISGVEMVSSAQHTIGGGTSGQGIYRFGENDKTFKSINEYRVLPGLCELMEFNLKNGNFFRENDPANKKYVILNEEAVKMLDLKNPIGEKVVMFDDPMEIIGVVKNFYYSSPAQKIEPIALTCYRYYPQHIYIRFSPTVNKAQAIQSILPVFRQFDPEFLLSPSWSEDLYNAKFNGEKTLSKIIFISTLLSLLVAILGLFAIHSFTISRRIKEVGIRKVSGSSVWSVVVLLSGNVFFQIGISAFISLPITWLVGQYWLENYSNRIQIGLLLLLIPLIIHMVIALVATFAISYRAATRNPVEALRYE